MCWLGRQSIWENLLIRGNRFMEPGAMVTFNKGFRVYIACSVPEIHDLHGFLQGNLTASVPVVHHELYDVE
jgi:hypothetical protein